MADEPENLTLKLLREIRAEGKTQSELLGKAMAAITELQVSLAATRTDVGIIKETVEQVHKTQQNHGVRLNAIDGRLAIIEERTGLVKA